MSEETKVKVDQPVSEISPQESVLRLMNTLLGPSRQEEKRNRHVQIKEDEEYSDDSEENTEDEDESDEEESSDEDEDWETLMNLVDSHRRLCRAFSTLLEKRE